MGCENWEGLSTFLRLMIIMLPDEHQRRGCFWKNPYIYNFYISKSWALRNFFRASFHYSPHVMYCLSGSSWHSGPSGPCILHLLTLHWCSGSWVDDFFHNGWYENNFVHYSMEYYLQKTYYKTASLISNSCKAIALLAGQTAEVSMLAYDYGRNLVRFCLWHPFLSPSMN